MVFQWSSREVPDGDLVVEHAPDAVYSEMFRQVRTGFQFATQSCPGNGLRADQCRSQEGKSTMISNLGAALAQGREPGDPGGQRPSPAHPLPLRETGPAAWRP